MSIKNYENPTVLVLKNAIDELCQEYDFEKDIFEGSDY